MLDITDPIDSSSFRNITENRPASPADTGSGSLAGNSSWNTWNLIALSELSTFFQAGELITRANNLPETLYVVGSGAVKSFYLDARGNECIMGFYLPGEIFGLEGLNRNNESFAHQMLKTGHLYQIPYREIFHTLRKDMDFQKYILQLLSHEMFEAQRMSVINGHYTAEVRLAYFLLDLWQRLNPKKTEEAVFTLPMTRVAISNFLGLTPETISRCLALFKRHNWIETTGSRIKLTDIESLSHLVTGLATR